MKREHKFRGKRLDNGEWVVGSLLQDDYGTCMIVEFVDHHEQWHEVDPETVGEYTGLKDIFEDDIINVRFGANNEPIPMQVLFENGSWCMKEYWGDTLHDLYSYDDEIEGVIGNMFDSPEKFITE